MAAEKSTQARWCADCWERWAHTAWKHTDFLEWLWTSPKSAIFVQITALHAWHLNESLFPAEKLWVYGLRMTVGMCLLLGSQLGMIITFFFVKRKCYRQLNVLSGCFEGGFLVKSPLFLSLLWFSFARSRFTGAPGGWWSIIFLFWWETMQNLHNLLYWRGWRNIRVKGCED